MKELGVYAQRWRARKRFWVEKGVFMAGLTLFRKRCSEQEQQGNATGRAEGGGGRPGAGPRSRGEAAGNTGMDRSWCLRGRLGVGRRGQLGLGPALGGT